MSSAWAIGFGVSPMLQECKGKKKDFQKWSNIFHALAAKHSNQIPCNKNLIKVVQSEEPLRSCDHF